MATPWVRGKNRINRVRSYLVCSFAVTWVFRCTVLSYLLYHLAGPCVYRCSPPGRRGIEASEERMPNRWPSAPSHAPGYHSGSSLWFDDTAGCRAHHVDPGYSTLALPPEILNQTVRHLRKIYKEHSSIPYLWSCFKGNRSRGDNPDNSLSDTPLFWLNSFFTTLDQSNGLITADMATICQSTNLSYYHFWSRLPDN